MEECACSNIQKVSFLENKFPSHLSSIIKWIGSASKTTKAKKRKLAETQE